LRPVTAGWSSATMSAPCAARSVAKMPASGAAPGHGAMLRGTIRFS